MNGEGKIRVLAIEGEILEDSKGHERRRGMGGGWIEFHSMEEVVVVERGAILLFFFFASLS